MPYKLKLLNGKSHVNFTFEENTKKKINGCQIEKNKMDREENNVFQQP